MIEFQNASDSGRPSMVRSLQQNNVDLFGSAVITTVIIVYTMCFHNAVLFLDLKCQINKLLVCDHSTHFHSLPHVPLGA